MPLVRARYPDGALRVADLDQLVDAAQQASDPRHFVAELVLDPPSSSADIAQPPHLDEDYLNLSTIHSAKGLEWDSVHVLAVYDGNFPACMAAGTQRGDRRGAPAALRRHDPRAPRPDGVRAGPLPPPPTRVGRRPRLRQALALPDARGPGVLRRDAAARRPAEPVRRAGRDRPAGDRCRPTRCSTEREPSGRCPPRASPPASPSPLPPAASLSAWPGRSASNASTAVPAPLASPLRRARSALRVAAPPASTAVPAPPLRRCAGRPLSAWPGRSARLHRCARSAAPPLRRLAALRVAGPLRPPPPLCPLRRSAAARRPLPPAPPSPPAAPRRPPRGLRVAVPLRRRSAASRRLLRAETSARLSRRPLRGGLRPVLSDSLLTDGGRSADGAIKTGWRRCALLRSAPPDPAALVRGRGPRGRPRASSKSWIS